MYVEKPISKDQAIYPLYYATIVIIVVYLCLYKTLAKNPRFHQKQLSKGLVMAKVLAIPWRKSEDLN